MQPRLISPSLRARPRKRERRKSRQLGTACPDRQAFYQSVCSRLPPRYHAHLNAKTEKRSSLRNWDPSGLGAREGFCPRGRWKSEIFELGSKQLNNINSSHSAKTQELITYNHPPTSDSEDLRKKKSWPATTRSQRFPLPRLCFVQAWSTVPKGPLPPPPGIQEARLPRHLPIAPRKGPSNE